MSSPPSPSAGPRPRMPTRPVAEEIVPFEVGGRRPVTVSTDKHLKPDTTVETLAGLRPAF